MSEWCSTLVEAQDRTFPHPAEARPGGLLATKLYLPRATPGFVIRSRLVDRLEEGLGHGLLILACAPAGFGKTALLADWSRRGRRPVAWLSLDAGDNDPVRFWRHVVAALDQARSGTADRVLPLLGPPAPKSFEGLLTAIINDLATERGEILLVLDDYHLIDSPAVHESLAFLLEHLPHCAHLVISSRSDPPLPLARLRARRQLAEVRAADLRFTTPEAAALLREAIGQDLGDDTVAGLVARSEGWVAGLQLAALSLRGQPHAAGTMATFSGSHRYVLDYLTEEVLQDQPEPVRTFLLETSVLERLSGPLCDAVTGRTDGQAMLEAIERANLFLVPLDEVRGWWRYHHLFADLLRVRLDQLRPQRVPELHRRAAAWLDENDFADDAVGHARAAGDLAVAARLVERHADAHLMRGEGATVQRWLAALPGDLIGTRPRLLLTQALLALLGGRVEAVEAPLDAAERVAADAAEEPYEPSVGRAASALANVHAAIALDRAHLAELRGNADRAIAFGRRALDEIGTTDSLLSTFAEGRLGVAHWLAGEVDEAERTFTASIGRWNAADERYLAIRGCDYLAQVRRAQGRLDGALEACRQALDLATIDGRPVLPAAGAARIGIAEVLYQRDDLDAAMCLATEGVSLCRQLAYSQQLANGLATLAAVREAVGDRDGALTAMAEAERVMPSTEIVDLLNPVPAQRARLALASGDLTTAIQWIDQRGLSPADEPRYPEEPAYLVLARVLLARGMPDRALPLLTRMRADATTCRRTGSLIEIQVMRALALAAAGYAAQAAAALTDAVVLACPQGYIRVFIDEGPPLESVLARIAAEPPPAIDDAVAAYLVRLTHAFRHHTGGAVGPPAVSRTAPGLVPALSDRELQVLRLLALGRQNQEIADELFVTRNTVKKHVTHILEKLGATNRTQATVRARELGLLS